MTRLNSEQQRVLDIVSEALHGHPQEGNDDLIPELMSQAVFSVVFPSHNMSISVIASNIQVLYEHVELHELLTAHHIPYVILKGAASASYYSNPILRTMGDVDFLIAPSDFSKATDLLTSIGFTYMEQDTDGIHIAFHRDGSTWEMHRSINGIPGGKAGNQVRQYLSDIIETAVAYDGGNGVIKIPDDFHHGLVLLIHTASHLTAEGVGLRHLCDWAVFVNRFTDAQFCTLFEEKLTACGLWRFAQLLSLTCVKYLHFPYQAWMGDANEDILEQLITDIMNGGNFGKKDKDRYRQIKYISNRGEHTVDQKNVILQLWDTIEKKAKVKGKSRIAVVGDYASMLLKGERKPDSGSTMKQAAKRKKLYSEFHLFEV